MCDECNRSSPLRRNELRRQFAAEREAWQREAAEHEEKERREAERVEAARREEQRQEELKLISAAKALAAERKHQADVAWARRVLADDADGEGTTSRESIPKAVRHAVWQRDGGKCVECGSSENLEFDHVIPIGMGGANTERNLQLLCERCNRRKGKSLG
jgi:5-methylcytosine-specific restriction endonuclease McrA